MGLAVRVTGSQSGQLRTDRHRRVDGKMANQEEIRPRETTRQVAKQPPSQSSSCAPSQSAGKFGSGLLSRVHSSRGDTGNSRLPHKMCHWAPQHNTFKSGLYHTGLQKRPLKRGGNTQWGGECEKVQKCTYDEEGFLCAVNRNTE